MDQGKLRYRIVGGVVLLAALAILVPVLNDVRQPLPQGPQAIDIPAEPADGLAAQVPADGAAPDADSSQPGDISDPIPAPPLSEQGEEPPPDSTAAPEPASPPPTVMAPEPAKPAPAPKPAPAKPPVASVAKPSAPPPAPAVVKPAPATKAPAVVAAPVAPKPAPVVKPAPTVTPAPAAPSAAKAPAPSPAPPAPATATQQAWVVQLGVYGNLKTAIDLRERLRKAGHSAFTEEVATPQGKALRVRVGPELDRATAQALRDRLNRETGNDGIVVAYP